MKSFEDIVAANFKPIPGVDRNTNAQLRSAARAAFADCWNAAIDQAHFVIFGAPIQPDAQAIAGPVNGKVLERLKVSK